MNWQPSLSFRRFRQKHYELNRLYWTQVLGNQALIDRIANLDDEELTISHILPDAKTTRHMHTAKETRQWAEDYLKRSRLHLLVICAGNLETFLQEITFWFTAVQGYIDHGILKLSPVGQAMAKSILGRASLPEPLKYAEEYFELSLGEDRQRWQRFYKLRSAAAHNGGIVTARTIKEVPDLNQPLGEPIGLEWNELKLALAAAERIAKKIDRKVTSKELRVLEVKNELRGLAAIDHLPVKEGIWSFIHKQYGLKGLSNQEKKELLGLFYP